MPADLRDRLAGVGVPAGKVLKVSEVVTDPQVVHREQIQALPAPIGLQGDFMAVNLGFKSDADGPTLTRPPPGVGEHNDEVLQELGYDEAAINTLRKDEVI